jgi:peroxiredoxin Q/BCP
LSAASTPRAAAPDFTLPAAGGDSHGPSFTLSDFRKQLVVLYFYPKDSTPGCTTEAQAFRALHDEFRQVGCMVVGISRDTLKSHDSFRLKQDLPFPLLADTDETACQRYGVIKMKKLYGKDVRGIERSTFLIDRDGRIAREWRGVKVAGHAAEVLEAVRALR